MISVIVPVYKVEDYLRECVDSILAQSFADFELILVDDGSPDSCGVICDEYAKIDSRVRVIHQENMGLSGARNTGIDVAAGELLTFVDSDDVIKIDYLEKLCYALWKENADIAVTGAEEFTDGENVSICSDNSKEDYFVIDNITGCIRIYEGDHKVPVNACGKLFRKDCIKNMRFPVRRLHEDQRFVPIACYNAEKIAVFNENLYLYRVRPESITKTKFSLKRYDDLWAIDECIDFFRGNNEKEILNAALKKRQRLLCVYSIYAYRDKVAVPPEYKVSIVRALSYLRKNVSADKFEYYLAQVNDGYVIWYEYLRKIQSILGGKR